VRLRLPLAVVVAAVVGTMLTPTVAVATGTGYFDHVRTHPRVDSACLYLPYTAHLTLGSDTSAWSVETTVLHPDGTVAHRGFGSGVGSGSATVTEDLYLCDPRDPLGTYTVVGVLDTDEVDSSHHSSVIPSITFEVVPVVVTTVRLTSRQTSFVPGGRVTFTIRPRASGADLPQVKLRLQRKGAGDRWRWWGDRHLVPLNRRFVVTKTVTQHRDLKVRALLLGDQWYYASQSSVLRVACDTRSPRGPG
jgi:hypothetical protein